MSGHLRGAVRGLGIAVLVVALSATALLVGASAAALTSAHSSAPAQSGSPQPGGSVLANGASPTAGPSTEATGSAGLPAIPAGAVPILYYHRVEAPPPDYATWTKAQQAAFIDYDVIPAAFAAQLDWLAANGYTTILPRDLAAHWDNGAQLPAKPVILTFDDGWHDWVSTVLPMLQARHMRAEFYLTLTAIADGNISWPEVQTLADAGEGIGAHDVHHVQLAELGAGKPDAAPATMWAEVNGAREAIGSHIGVYPDSMAYVGGGFSPELEALVEQAGYTTARSIRRGIVQTIETRYELHVVRIGPYDDVTNRATWTIDPGLPTFVARMHGVSDLPPGS
ncbi:MAG TPA: polysaccharide deacetylase family protein [Candidatus Limnocylindrales bacterium]